jgi:hypothetical protein
VLSFTSLAALPPGKIADGAHCTDDCLGLRAGLDSVSKRKIFCTYWDSSPDRPARSPSLYRLLRILIVSTSSIASSTQSPNSPSTDTACFHSRAVTTRTMELHQCWMKCWLTEPVQKLVDSNPLTGLPLLGCQPIGGTSNCFQGTGIT